MAPLWVGAIFTSAVFNHITGMYESTAEYTSEKSWEILSDAI